MLYPIYLKAREEEFQINILTENCGLLNHILPGDQILADHGFNVQESVGLYWGEIKIPPFTKGKK